MRINLAQIRHHGSIQANKQKICGIIREAVIHEVDIVCFPETALSGYLFEGFSRLNFAEIDRALDEIGSIVRGSKLHVIIGTPRKSGAKVFNSAAILTPTGGCQFYDKIWLVPYEREFFDSGSDELVFEVNDARFGVMICRDMKSPDFARDLKAKGAKGVFVLSAHYYEQIESRMKLEKNVALPIVRAYENGLYIFKSNAVGTLGNMISYGNSMLVDSRGIVLLRAGETQEEQLLYDADFGKENPVW
jgi:predicted amidohydrolase